jgi:hypothetical protein
MAVSRGGGNAGGAGWGGFTHQLLMIAAASGVIRAASIRIDVKLGRRGNAARVNVKLGDPLNGYYAKSKVRTIAEAAVWLRNQACRRHPDSGFARKHSRLRLIGSR